MNIVIAALSLINNIYIINHTSYEADFVAQYLHDEKINNVTVVIKYFPEVIRYKVSDPAFVRQASEDLYIIYIKKNRPDDYSRILLLHEIIHVKQYKKRDLVRISKSIIQYKGRRYNLNHYSRDDLPHEIDCEKECNRIKKKYFMQDCQNIPGCQ